MLGNVIQGGACLVACPVLRTTNYTTFIQNSVLTLYGFILAPILNLFKLPFLVFGS